MSYCTYCGAPMRRGARSCTSCGTEVATLPQPDAAPVGADAPTWATSDPDGSDLLPYVSPTWTERPAGRARGPDPGRVVALILLAMVVAAALGGWLLLRGEESDVATAVTPRATATAPVVAPPVVPPPASTISSAPTTPEPSTTTPEPSTTPSILVPVEANASSTAPNSVDDAGSPVSFGPDNAIDGDRETAWRAAEGDGVGEFLTFDLGAAYPVTTVGLIPGYDKVDPATGQSRFFQNRRIERVRWIFDDGSSVVQRFSDDATMQTASVSVTTGTIRVEIEATRPPRTDDGRDFAPISEVLVVSLR